MFLWIWKPIREVMSLFGRNANQKPFRKKGRFRLSLEDLEPRITPTDFIWVGAGKDAKWNTAENWQIVKGTVNNAHPVPGDKDNALGQTDRAIFDRTTNMDGTPLKQLN